MSPHCITKQFVPISEIKTQDVLFRKGGPSASHIGTIALKAIIQTRLQAYVNANLSNRRNADKTFVTLQVVTMVHLTGGRFLVEEEQAQTSARHAYVLDIPQARVRVREFFREFIKKAKKQLRPCALLEKMGVSGLFGSNSTYTDIVVFMATSPQVAAFLIDRNNQIQKRKKRERSCIRSKNKRKSGTAVSCPPKALPANNDSLQQCPQVTPIPSPSPSPPPPSVESTHEAQFPSVFSTLATAWPTNFLASSSDAPCSVSSTRPLSWDSSAHHDHVARPAMMQRTPIEPYLFPMPQKELVTEERQQEYFPSHNYNITPTIVEKEKSTPPAFSSSSLVSHLMASMFADDDEDTPSFSAPYQNADNCHETINSILLDSFNISNSIENDDDEVGLFGATNGDNDDALLSSMFLAAV